MLFGNAVGIHKDLNFIMIRAADDMWDLLLVKLIKKKQDDKLVHIPGRVESLVWIGVIRCEGLQEF